MRKKIPVPKNKTRILHKKTLSNPNESQNLQCILSIYLKITFRVIICNKYLIGWLFTFLNESKRATSATWRTTWTGDWWWLWWALQVATKQAVQGATYARTIGNVDSEGWWMKPPHLNWSSLAKIYLQCLTSCFHQFRIFYKKFLNGKQ